MSEIEDKMTNYDKVLKKREQEKMTQQPLDDTKEII